MSEKTTQESFEALATGLPQLVFGCRETGERTWPSPQWIAYSGLSADESVGFGWLQAIHPDDWQTTLAAWAEAPAQRAYTVEHRVRHAADGEFRWHLTRAAPLLDPPDRNLEWVGSSTDVHKIYGLRSNLADAEQKLRTLVEGVPQLLWRSCNSGEWTWSSPQWRRFTGQTLEQSRGRGWLDVVHPADREATLNAWAAARSQGVLDTEFRVRRAADGRYIWHRTRSTPVHDKAGVVIEWLGTTIDVHNLRTLQQRQQILLADMEHHTRKLQTEVSERKRVEEKLLYDAQHDGLTGLHNRAFLMNRLRIALGQSSGMHCAILFLDLDRFKLVNDSLGHQAGDLLLVEIATRLRRFVSPSRTLARFGGDEFTLLVEDTDVLGVAEALAAQIIEAFGKPIQLSDQVVYASCSIGVVAATHHYLLAEDVLRDADIAMYHAKRNNSGGHAVFAEAMRIKVVETLDLRTDLRHAVDRNEFILHYQPICDVLSKAIVGVEALVRWQHPRRGTLPPGSFIGFAEETGTIRDIGRWVLREACMDMRRWRSAFPSLDLCLNVNASGTELKAPHFIEYIESTLRSVDLNPRCLQLEITEGVFLHQPERIGELLKYIRSLGVRIALDDFGTGFSSLGYLDRYKVDTIKIDKSFVAGVPSRHRAVAILDTIVRLGRNIGLEVVAEGVENDDQFDTLQALNCSLVQGYLLGRPCSPIDISAALSRQSTLADRAPPASSHPAPSAARFEVSG